MYAAKIAPNYIDCIETEGYVKSCLITEMTLDMCLMLLG
ncbi:hypothetical protein GPLA_1770 [Paraglaciecola polaris LMG 21857]|uniref:Uncharacterized protein n=1 Tax=Paraglaciecola polaris LMG 21857 TaxID=1129793 RepID=K7ABC5_9ALTE|nr:hypothetical protein GPLA_1770 [Paraglaciecola polaris LMG 21857]